MSLRFRVLRGDNVNEFEFDRDRVTIGRGPTNDVVLDDVSVARKHGAFERRSDGSLFWCATAPSAFVRGGSEVDRTFGDEPRQWELTGGDVLEFEGEAQIAIEVLSTEFEPAASPTFIPFGAPPSDIGPELVQMAEQLHAQLTPGALLACFEELLARLGVSGGRATFVMLSGPEEYLNEAWHFTQACCAPALDPTALLGAAAAEIRAYWDEKPCVAMLGSHALVPIGNPSLRALIVFEHAELSSAVDAVASVAPAMRPFANLFVEQLSADRARGALVEENRYFRARQRQHYLFKELVRESEAMRAVHERLHNLRDEDRPVLFTGEAGTGKELFARLLHHESNRADQMIMRVNCAEFADETANLELFGTSVDESCAGPRKGVFELARQGTVLLEEIDMLPPMVQAKLCRTLKEREVRRLGESVGRPIGARVIASLHRDVSECVAEGRLRRDLYLLFRDQTILVPALRDRRKDILPLAAKFLDVYATRYARRVESFSEEAQTRMLNHFWPGNVRELQARVEAAVLGTNGSVITVAHLGLG